MSSRYAYLIAAVAAISGLLFGFDTAVINGALIFLRQELALSTRGTELATSSLLVGCAIGAAFAGWLTDRLGRKRILIVSALLFAASAVGAAVPRNLGEFVAARLVGGLAIGAASVLAPLYIAEISPRAIRGRLVSLNQMAIVTGILLAYFVNWLLSFAGPSSWRWMFASAAIPSAAFFLALLFVPESPRFLVETGRETEALAVLERVGERPRRASSSPRSGTRSPRSRGRCGSSSRSACASLSGIAVFLAVFQQVTGINTVIYYGSLIFKEQVGGQSDSAAIGANVVVGTVNFLMTIVALWTIDRLGRRPLMMLASGGHGGVAPPPRLPLPGPAAPGGDDPGGHPALRGLVRRGARARGVGRHLGALPDPHPGAGDVDRHPLPLARVHPGHGDLPLAGRGDRLDRRLLALRGDERR